MRRVRRGDGRVLVSVESKDTEDGDRRSEQETDLHSRPRLPGDEFQLAGIDRSVGASIVAGVEVLDDKA